MLHRVIMLCLLEFHNLRRGVLTNSTRSADRTMPHTLFHIVVPKSACLLRQGTWSTPKPCATVTSRAAWDLKSFAHQRSTSASIAGTHTDEKDQWSHSADKHQQQKGIHKALCKSKPSHCQDPKVASLESEISTSKCAALTFAPACSHLAAVDGILPMMVLLGKSGGMNSL